MIDRDKFLAEAMGGWWHYSVYTGRGNECSCGKWWSECSKNHPDFSTWEGFGKLFTSLGKLGFSSNEIEGAVLDSYPYDNNFPDRFANLVYKYLKETNHGL